MNVFNVYLYVSGPVLDELNLYIKTRGWWFFPQLEPTTLAPNEGLGLSTIELQFISTLQAEVIWF